MPSIESYREIATGKPSVDYGHRVTIQGGQLVKAPESWKDRSVTWLQGNTLLEQGENRQTIDDFRQALTDAYGQAIATAVFNASLLAKRIPGDNLSTRGIQEALQTADTLRSQQIATNSALMNLAKGTVLDQRFQHVTGQPIQALYPKEIDSLRSVVMQRIRTDPRFATGAMTAGDMQNLVDFEINAVLQRRADHFASRYGASAQRLNLAPQQLPSAAAIQDQILGLPPHLNAEATTLSQALLRANATFQQLDACPLSDPDVQQAITNIQADVTALQQQQVLLNGLLGHASQQVQDLATDLHADLGTLIQALTSKEQYLQGLQGTHPLSETNVDDALSLWDSAAKRVLTTKLGQGTLAEQAAHQVIDQAALLRQGNLNPNQLVQNPKTLTEQHEKALLQQIRAQLGTNGIAVTNVDTDLKAAYLQAMNSDQPWTPVQTTIQYTENRQLHQLDSLITPARHIAPPLDPLTVSYVTSGQNGICSESKREPTHAINLATATLVDPQTNETLFVGVRHGIHSASGLTGIARTNANQNRAAESVTAALLSNQAVFQQALTNARPGGNGNAVNLDIVSLSLVTPTYDLVGGESSLWQDQLAAWNHVNANSPHTIQVWDPGVPPHVAAQLRNVTVNVRVLPMNWGVNPGAITYGAGWSDVQETNREALKHLLGGLSPHDQIGGLAGQYLAGGASAQDKQVVRELVEQIREIWTAGSYKSDADQDIYKMTSRLALLAHKLGATPMWNCKSGKDRTGHLDAEAKFLAAEIRYSGHVPPYGQLSPLRKNQFKEFALNSGNLEIQRYNTGLAGYKTFNMKSNVQRLGDPAAASRYTGGGAFVEH